MTPRQAAYDEAMQRLRDAQRAYAALQDPRADWQHVQAACRAVVIARADLEHILRQDRRAVETAY